MESTIPAPVAPVRPLAPYIGGKRFLARRIIELIGQIPHRTYAEPFVGMGGVFFRRPAAAKVEVINDWSAEVANLFRILQVHYVAFVEMLRFQLTTRAEFERLVRVRPDTLTDLQRAAAFLYLQRTAYGGKVTGRNFAMTVDRPPRFNVAELPGLLEAVHERLAGVLIERLPWADFIVRYDSPATLFYLDPPYWGCESDYGEGMFGRAEFAQMAEVLGRLKGRFVLSLNDRPEVREIFDAFEIRAAATHYGVAGKGAAAAKEVIILGP